MDIIKDHKFSEFFKKNSESERNVDFLVFHHIEAQSSKEAMDLLKEHEVSSHYLIDESGQILLLVEENDIAYHAGVSYFAGFDGLNVDSIGVEILTSDALSKGFSTMQLDALIELSNYLIDKYSIRQQNIVGHSDIAYFSDNCDKKFADQIGCLDRKDDPSHMFNWKYMSKNGVSLFPSQEFTGKDGGLYKIGDNGPEILEIKRKLAIFGYKVDNLDENFDIEMKNLCRVFNRRFNPDQYLVDPDIWWKSSEFLLGDLYHLLLCDLDD